MLLVSVVAGAAASCGLPQPAPAIPAPAGTTRPAVAGSAPGAVPVTAPPATPADFADPASVAAHYVAAVCAFSWRQPYGVREQRAGRYLTPAAAHRSAPSAAGRAAWQAAVVRDGTVGDCQILLTQPMTEAPNTSSRRYLRVVAHRRISRRSGTSVDDEPEYQLLLTDVGGRWLVDAASPGG